MKHLYTAIQGFAAGSIAMAYISNYNTRQLPIAIVCLVISIISRLGNEQ